MSAPIPAYLEIIDFIAAGTTPAAIVQFRSSFESRKRVAELIKREQGNGCLLTRKPNSNISWNWSTSSEWLKLRQGKFSLVASDICSQVRQKVAQWAIHQCEYCLIAVDDAGFPHQIVANMAVVRILRIWPMPASSAIVIRARTLALIDQVTGETVRLFHPRRDQWADHFRVSAYICT